MSLTFCGAPWNYLCVRLTPSTLNTGNYGNYDTIPSPHPQPADKGREICFSATLSAADFTTSTTALSLPVSALYHSSSEEDSLCESTQLSTSLGRSASGDSGGDSVSLSIPMAELIQQYRRHSPAEQRLQLQLQTKHVVYRVTSELFERP